MPSLPTRNGPGPVSVGSFAASNGIAGPRGRPQQVARATPQNRTPPAAASNAWTTVSKSKASRARTRAGPMPTISEDATQLTAQVANMSLNGPVKANPNTYNPSNGPSPSMMTTNSVAVSAAPSNATGSSMGRVFNRTAACILGRFKRRNFKRGEIISIPYHVPNTNPNMDLTDTALSYSEVGPVYSKRRMWVILWIYADEMFCVPLYTFSGRGLQSKPKHLIPQYVCVMDEGTEDFENQGNYPPIEVKCKYPFPPTSTIDLVGGMKVGCKENIAKVGRVSEESLIRLMKLWKKLSSDAWKEAY